MIKPDANLNPSHQPLSAQTNGSDWGCRRLTLEHGKLVMEDLWIAGVAAARSFERTLVRVGSPLAQPLTAEEASTPLHKHRKRFRLSEEARVFVAAKQLTDKHPATPRRFANTLEFLKAIAGDLFVDEIESHHLVAMFEALSRYPANAHKLGRFKGKSINEVLDMTVNEVVQGIGGDTRSGHHSRLMQFLDRLTEQKKIRTNPLRGLGLDPGTSHEPKEHKLFRLDELRSVFEPMAFGKWAKVPHRWWLPILGLYTGCRIGELAQLRKCDIIDDHGQWEISIEPGERGSLKTEQSRRRIPLAPALVELGFLEFFSDMQSVPHERLFPLLAKPKTKISGKETGEGYGTKVTQDFYGYARKIELAEGRSMHSFRHHFITHLLRDGVEIEVIKSMSGHSRLLQTPGDKQRSSFSAYAHDMKSALFPRARAALEAVHLDIEIPKYTGGQFAKQLAETEKFAP